MFQGETDHVMLVKAEAQILQNLNGPTTPYVPQFHSMHLPSAREPDSPAYLVMG